LNVAAAADNPVGNPDVYAVPIGGRLQVLNPIQGILSNDTDADSDLFPGTNQKLRVHLPSVTGTNPTSIGNGTGVRVNTTRGQLDMFRDGTFIYTNTSGVAGGTDSFTYRPIDPTNRLSLGNPTTVTINLGQSQYQNPIPGRQFDVTADGEVTPLDALVILTLLAERQVAGISVSQLTTAPPDFYDVNGDGLIEPLDSLEVIIEVGRLNQLQRIGSPEGEAVPLAIASTSQIFAASSISLPEIERRIDDTQSAVYTVIADPMNDWVGNDDDDHADLLADDVITRRTDSSGENITIEAIDEALLSWMDATNL
jgi:hypothetical protein